MKAIKRNLDALAGFVAQARRNLKKKQFKALKHDLNQARGRLSNLFIILEDLENGLLTETQFKEKLKELEK